MRFRHPRSYMKGQGNKGRISVDAVQFQEVLDSEVMKVRSEEEEKNMEAIRK